MQSLATVMEAKTFVVPAGTRLKGAFSRAICNMLHAHRECWYSRWSGTSSTARTQQLLPARHCRRCAAQGLQTAGRLHGTLMHGPYICCVVLRL